MAATAEDSFFTLYLNGMAVGSKRMNLNTAAYTSFLVGRIPQILGEMLRLHGEVDEIGIYSRALSSDEIFGICEAGSIGRCPVPRFVSVIQSLTVAVGGTVTIDSDIVGARAMSYQWQENGKDLIGGTDFAFPIFNAQFPDAATYSVSATNAFGKLTGIVAQLSVLPITIEAQPSSQSVFEGDTVTFHQRPAVKLFGSNGSSMRPSQKRRSPERSTGRESR